MKMKQLITATSAIALAVSAQVNAGTVTSKGSDIVVSTKSGISVKTVDGKSSFGLGGRIQWDYNRAEYQPAAGGDAVDEDNFGVRRARIYTKGHFGDWGYKAQFNIGEDGADAGDVEDLYITYNGWGDIAKVTIGRSKAPFSLEELTSSKDISILERGAATELFAIGRGEGLKLNGKKDMFTYGFGIFEGGNATDDDNLAADTITAVGRVTAAPINADGTVLHLGLGFQQSDDDGQASLKDAYNVEVAGTIGAFHAQAEFFDGETLDGTDVDSFYVQAGWILTGESRPYKDGVFKGISSKEGAWELVARYTDGWGNYGDIELDTAEGEAMSVGLNYYHNNIRLGATYMTGEEDISGDEGEEFRIRFQYAYK
jgi:phosphate-selective porin OprO/OprP